MSLLALCYTAVYAGYNLPAETEKLLKATKQMWLRPTLNKEGVNHHFKTRQIGAFVVIHSQRTDIDYVLCVKQKPEEGKSDNHARIELQKLHGPQVCFASGRGRVYNHLEHLIGDAVASSMDYFRIPMFFPTEPATIASALETGNLLGPEATSPAKQRQGEQGGNNARRDGPQAPAPALDIDHIRAAAALTRGTQQRTGLKATAEDTAAAVKIQTCMRGESKRGRPSRICMKRTPPVASSAPCCCTCCCCFMAQPHVPGIAGGVCKCHWGVHARTLHNMSEHLLAVFSSPPLLLLFFFLLLRCVLRVFGPPALAIPSAGPKGTADYESEARESERRPYLCAARYRRMGRRRHGSN